MSYNVENLFDTFNDPATADDDFTPKGRLKWTSSKYNSKLVNIYKVIAGIGEVQPPDIIGLCEVENRRVINDLLTLTPLSKYKYGVVHNDSPDGRGIDVAILYRLDFVKLIDSRAIKINFPGKDIKVKTRDIAMAKFLVANMDTLYVFMNHWPSRRRGELESQSLRVFVAKVLQKEINLMFSGNKNAKVIAMGDFNDEPSDKSLVSGLDACILFDKISESSLYNMSVQFPLNTIQGTHWFRGKWQIFDQIIVSGILLKSTKGLNTSKTSVKIFAEPFLLNKDETYLGIKPFPTYSGFKYLGGYSDHLPVYIDIFAVK